MKSKDSPGRRSPAGRSLHSRGWWPRNSYHPIYYVFAAQAAPRVIGLGAQWATSTTNIQQKTIDGQRGTRRPYQRTTDARAPRS